MIHFSVFFARFSSNLCFIRRYVLTSSLHELKYKWHIFSMCVSFIQCVSIRVSNLFLDVWGWNGSWEGSSRVRRRWIHFTNAPTSIPSPVTRKINAKSRNTNFFSSRLEMPVCNFKTLFGFFCRLLLLYHIAIFIFTWSQSLQYDSFGKW